MNAPLKQEEFKSGQVVEFEYKGETHEGAIHMEYNSIYLCQNLIDNDGCDDKHGFDFVYYLSCQQVDEITSDHNFKNIRLKEPAPETKEETKAKRKKMTVESIVIRILDGVEYKKGHIGDLTVAEHVAKIRSLRISLDEANLRNRRYKAEDKSGRLD